MGGFILNTSTVSEFPVGIHAEGKAGVSGSLIDAVVTGVTEAVGVAFIAQRKPKASRALSGVSALRSEERRKLTSPFHMPPRNTRYCPEFGPEGLDCGELA